MFAPKATTDVELMTHRPRRQVFTAFSFDAVQQVLKDGETFSSAGYAEVMGQVMGHTILEMDEPEHHTYRGLVQQAFSRKAMETWERELVRGVVDEHIDAFIDRGRADLVRELTFPFPVVVIARLLGLPREDLPMFHRQAVELISAGFDLDRATTRVASAVRLLLRDHRRAARAPLRRRDLGARAGRARRHAPHRRRDLRVPAPAAPGRCRDDVPLVEQPALRPAHATPTSSTRCAPTAA